MKRREPPGSRLAVSLVGARVLGARRHVGCVFALACALADAACGSPGGASNQPGASDGAAPVTGNASGDAQAPGNASDAGAGGGEAGSGMAGDGAGDAAVSNEAGAAQDAAVNTGASTDAAGDGVSPVDSGLPDAPVGFVCNQVTGLTLTREWYEAGFENGVDGSRWQLKAMEHAYVEEWANPASTFWSTPIESACSQQSTSPDRLVFVVLSWTITAQAVWETQVTAAINNFKTNYPAVRRIDLLTVIRGPNNMLCPTPPAAGETIQMPASLDAALAAVSVNFPGFVYVGPKFEASSCADFNGGGPHLTLQGNTKAATAISAYFATH